ncbi:MAG: hypothetical protein Q8L37_05170 [Candidatus Gottesmanbacteria bacterium]|nr:hypothetical protein [Candidatus Gottesmanbacteria bacterium]
MPRPEYSSIAKRFADHERRQLDIDANQNWRASLAPDQYAEWKTSMLKKQLTRDYPDWQSGGIPLIVQRKVWAEFFGDDCTVLQFLLFEEGIDAEYIQIFLAKPWLAASKYVEVFGGAMNAEWTTYFQSFLDGQRDDVTRVIGESTENLSDGDLRSVASAFVRAVWDFRERYGQF